LIVISDNPEQKILVESKEVRALYSLLKYPIIKPEKRYFCTEFFFKREIMDI